MRVLLFHPWGRFDACCGAAHTARAQLEFFHSRGWEVHCVTQAIPAWGVTAGDVADVVAEFPCVKSVRAVSIDCPPVAPRHYGDEFRLLLDAAERTARGRAFRRIAAERWDAFFTTDVTAAPYAHALPRGTLKVLAAGDSHARRAAAIELAPAAVRDAERVFTFARVEAELYRLFNRVLFHCEEDAGEVRRHGVTSAVHVPPVAPHRDAGPREDCEHDLLICGGARSGDLADLEWFYRHVYLPHLRASGVRLAVAGPVVERFAVADRLVATVPSPEGVYQAARLVVVPACEAAGPHVPVLEALAAGCAVVTTPLGVRGLKVPEGGAVVLDVRNDPAEAAGVIRGLLADTDRRKEIGERAARVASRHTRERHLAALKAAWGVPAGVVARGGRC